MPLCHICEVDMSCQLTSDITMFIGIRETFLDLILTICLALPYKKWVIDGLTHSLRQFFISDIFSDLH